MRAGALYALGLLLAIASLCSNAAVAGKWYDRVGHVLINARLWACITLLEAWNALTVVYFLLSVRFRRSGKIDALALGLLSVLGFSAASASTVAGYLEFAQCAGYNRRCAMAAAGWVLNWISASYILVLLVLKVRQGVSWSDEGAYSPTETTHLAYPQDNLQTERKTGMIV
ncbi:hypothetical protein CC85DRAFT_284318 [Cutaneotrichosporon oleaginosum]|uniref:MARVEL domain-containing protein n=1 Tax=Cutaneotrichosporon oleaginosum TaxID=879819 RepID=A0A0J0XR58_9TREE|nr:uncharacterized protein CC85DRAFT_284318 [Cutaneotrichosporon oleaginosum]KLT43611.1 hypothetical protein CC85DRAFT_284318 [Cutaneotrichosporon oleaginosum]TXT12721.1 hypothetical protein COLE_03131 [Cutaneotrichosporon oleaginosum]